MHLLSSVAFFVAAGDEGLFEDGTLAAAALDKKVDPLLLSIAAERSVFLLL